MVRLKFGVISMLIGFSIFTGVPAQSADSNGEAPTESSTNGSSDITFRPIGYGSLEVGQIAAGYFRYAGAPIQPISHAWQQRAISWLGFNALVEKRLEINLAAGGFIVYSTPQLGSDPQTMQTRNIFFLKSAYAACPFGDPENISFKAQIGYFPYKYNPNVRNLGEYLFRSNAYPLLIYSDFDYPQADILGARINFQYKMPDGFLSLQNDLLLHSELYSVPVQDWSLSDVFSLKLFDALTVGGGISFANLFSVYQGQYGFDWMDINFSKPYVFRSIDQKDSASYDWKSTKAMAQLSFDPKRFIPLDIFGKNDLILYSELDFIGLKNYPQYENLANRMFITAGFNLPGFKVIDLINIEIEYCGDTSAFSDERLYNPGNTPDLAPIPINSASTLQVKRNPLRLSAYVKKSFFSGRLSFIAQCARDHKKINFYYYLRKNMSFMETLPATNNWWWAFKTEFTF
jgi:hypothetical protein